MREILFCVSIDTECDHTLSWAKPKPVTFHSVRYGLRQKLYPLFRTYGVRPTYLITSEVLEDKESVDALTHLAGACEFGTHLHPEYVEPYQKHRDPSGTTSEEFLSELPVDVQRAKLGTISQLFREAFGIPPCSFRAGRFGASSTILAALHDLGYEVDSSVTPSIRWTGKNGVLDFSNAPVQPYFPSSKNLSKQGSLPILEIPVTIGFLPLGKWFQRWLRGRWPIELPGLRFLCRSVWLRPSRSTVKEMIALIRNLDKVCGEASPLVLNMMFHSMEVIPGASPYSKSEEDVQRFLMRIEQVLKYCINRWRVTFTTLSEVSKYFRRTLPVG